jgi:ribosomal protein L28
MTTPNKVCKICGKGYVKAVSRSHSMRKTIKRLQPNLQWLTVSPGKRIKACTQCIKSVGKGKVKVENVAIK